MQYDKEDKNNLLEYYKKLITEHDDNSSQAQGWASNETENTRFKIFTKIGDLNNSSILDVGCGFGDLYDFLKKKDLNFTYKGIDINPEMIKVARDKHQDVYFETVDFCAYNLEEKFDYVFCSGALSFKIKNYKQFYFNYIEKMFELSNIGIAFNMLNSKNNVNSEDEKLFATYSISEVEEFCSNLTKKITILQDYLPNDFTFFLYH